MEKDEYKKLIQDKPWQWAEDHFDKLENYQPKEICTLDINENDWLDFSINNFDLAEQNYESASGHQTEFARKLAETNVLLGRNQYNSFEINYGIMGNLNYQMIEMLGMDNLNKLNFIPKYTLVRLLIKFPGQGVAWHTDTCQQYQKKFPDLKINQNTFQSDKGKIVRYWFSVTDWCRGHMFQISNTILWNYKKGQVFQIPFGQGHASSNAGLQPQFSVALTGIVKES